jgi:hypothetical protein
VITVDNITNEQIQELRKMMESSSVAEHYVSRIRESRRQVINLCDWSMERGHVQRYAARARCAEILNALNARKVGG